MRIKDRELKSILASQALPDKKKLQDGGGLYLLVKPTRKGVGMYWRFDFSFNKKRKTLSLGTYPLISISEARKAHKKAKVDLINGIDPAEQKKRKVNNTVADILEEWVHSPSSLSRWSKSYRSIITGLIKNDILPALATKPIDEVSPSDIVNILKKTNIRSLTQAYRCASVLKSFFKYAMTVGYVNSNPADINASIILPPYVTKHRPAITEPKEIGALLRKIDTYSGHGSVVALLKLSPFLMLRPSELRLSRWEEVDFEQRSLVIPVSRMKVRKHLKCDQSYNHCVPLAEQPLKILERLRQLDLSQTYLFPSPHRDKDQPLSSIPINYAFRKMGYPQSTLTAHGFRSMASTRLNDMRTEEGQPRFSSEAIEKQLAHEIGGTIKRSYDRGDYMSERIEMMQVWADYLNELKANT